MEGIGKRPLLEVLAEIRVLVTVATQMAQQGHGTAAELLISAIVSVARQGPRNFGLALPVITRDNKIMANVQLKNDQVMTITITEQNPATGAFDPVPAGDTFTLQVSDPASLNAVIGQDASGGPALVVNALKQAASGVSVTISDSAGSASFTQAFDIVADVKPDQLGLDLADAAFVAQTVPTS